MSESVTEPRVKGIAFRSIEASYADLRGDKARDQARKLMGSELRNLYNSGLILASSWYPISWYRDTFHAFRIATGEGLELTRQIGYEACKRDMQSVHKMVFAKLVSPQIMLRLSARLFNSYYDTGSYEVLDSRKHFVRVRFSGCFGWNHDMWTEMFGSSLCFLELSGAKSVRLRTISGGRDGDTEMRLEAHWI